MKENAKKILKEFINDFKINAKEIANKKTFFKQIPNILTFVRALAPIPFNVLYFTGNLKGAIIVLSIAFFTDAIDGKIARKYGLVSKFGAILDAVCDKLMVIGVIIPACFSNNVLFINLLFEIIIAFTNTFASLVSVKTESSKIGKLKTWPLFITIILSYMSLFININSLIITFMVTITAGLQVFTTLDYISKNFALYQKKLKK